MYGSVARCKPKMMIWRLVLRFCIRPVDEAFLLLAIMDIRARPISLAERPQRASLPRGRATPRVYLCGPPQSNAP